MAMHVSSVSASGIPQVMTAQFYDQIRWGDMLFCSGRKPMSDAIEMFTDSPWSHVLFTWLPAHGAQWLTLEATFARGVHVGKLADYVENYDGDLALARREAVGDTQKFAELNAGFALLEDNYDWREEITVAAHKLLKFFPIAKPKGEYYCSGLMYAMSLASRVPLQKPGPEMPTPEDNWTDPSVIPICALRNPTRSRVVVQVDGRVV